jgi:CRISPR-associated endonuclease/helicase Cas3
MRPIDRDELVREVQARVASGVQAEGERPLVLVATQCIEAGADLDFGAIVTELASFDALRQRFGRVDRLGTSGNARGTIIEVHELVEGKLALVKDDPVYGDRLVKCSKLLKALKKVAKKAPIDFGIDALESLLAKVDAELVQDANSAKRHAPCLFPAYLDLWAQTRPVLDRSQTPDVALFLHGPQAQPPNVNVIWRADLEAGVDADECLARIEALPPSALEAASIPFGAALSWIGGSAERASIADVEGFDGSPLPDSEAVKHRVFRWSGDGAEVLRPGALRPGDTIVVRSDVGGLTAGTFDAASSDAVSDRAEEAIRFSRHRLTVRLELRGVQLAADRSLLSPASAPQWVTEFCAALNQRGAREVRHVELEGWTLALARGFSLSDATTDDEESVATGRAVLLSVHSADVERWAASFASRLKLAPELAACVQFAGWLHDVGKADERFQRLLRDGTLASVHLARASGGDWLLAKSGLGPHDRAHARRARRLSGYAKGARHEVLSAAMCDTELVRAEAKKRGVADFELLLHLIASHHGWCRPFAPPYEVPKELQAEEAARGAVQVTHGTLALSAAPQTTLHRLDAGLAERFARLTVRYGWHQLAALEMIVRLADHKASEEEARGEHADA